MSGQQKITLAEAKDSGATALAVYCATAPAGAPGCRHKGCLGIDEAIERWGAERRLDALPLVCSRCGGRVVDVRPDFGPRTKGGKPLDWGNGGAGMVGPRRRSPPSRAIR